MTPAKLLADLDELVAGLPAKELPVLVVALSSKVAQIAAGMLAVPRPDSGAGAAPDENLDVTEAARRLGVSRAFLYRNAERLPFALKIGRRRLFSARGLAAWAARRRGG